MPVRPNGVAPRRGRPRKFAAPSRAVTLTLPEHVLDALTMIDPDLSRAVVRLAQPAVGRRAHPPAELAVFGQRAVILVKPTRTLEKQAGVFLVPLSDGRALIAFDETTTPARFELTIQDELEGRRLPPGDARVFASIRNLLKQARRSKSMVLRQRNIMVIEHDARASRRA